MKRLAMLATALTGVVTLSAHSAIANQWSADLNEMVLAPGAIVPAFASMCSAALPFGNGDEEYDNDTGDEDDCSAEVLADWLTGAFGAMEIEELEALLAEFNVDGTVEYSVTELADMDWESLVVTMQDSDPLILAELCVQKGKAVPCRTGPAPKGSCTYGRKCTSATCKKSDGTVKNCKTIVYKEKNPLLIGCLNFTKTTYTCKDGCAPVPAWALLIGAVSSISVVSGRRKRRNVLARS